jgi:hypothetical protein
MDDLANRLFEKYAEEGEELSDEWLEDFFEKSLRGHPYWTDIEWEHQTDSNNFQSGDEAEFIYRFGDPDISAFWVQSSTGGLLGPFPDHDSAARALGYESYNQLPEETNPYDDEDDCEEEACDEEE